MAIGIVLWCVALLLSCAGLSVVIGRDPRSCRVTYGTSLAASSVALVAALVHLVADGGEASVLVLPLGLPWLGAHFRMDALAAFFLVVVNLGGAAACLYGLGYGRHEPAPQRVLPFYSAFLAGMNLVVLADDAFTFLLSWEFMSLASWALVVAHHRDRDNVRAGYIYLVMASFGTLSLLLAFGLLAGPAGAYGFDAIRNAEHAPQVLALVLGLVLLGAGSKAGLVPVHVWLPLAHPAAPSHVSALMSGVMTKVAVYGFIRIIFDLVGQPTWWAAMVVLALGGITAALGVLYALMQHDLKRLLAYHTVENIGIIYIGLGLSLAFQANGMGWAAALALTAALFHVLNHSLFKKSAVSGCRRRADRDPRAGHGASGRADPPHAADQLRLPGRMRRHFSPAAPEWLRVRMAHFPGHTAKPGPSAVGPPDHGAGGGWAVGAVGGARRGLFRQGLRRHVPRTAADARGGAGAGSRSLLARPPCLRWRLSVFLAGVMPSLVMDGLAPVTLALLGDRMPHQTGLEWLSIIPIAQSRSSYNGLLVFLFIAFSAFLTAFVMHRWVSRAVRRAPAWDCGFPDASPVTQYTAGSFAQPIRRVFGTLVFRAREQVEMPPPGDTGPARFRVVMRDLVWDLLYAPVAGAVEFAAERLNLLQFLTIRRYLSLVFFALVALLLALAIWQ